MTEDLLEYLERYIAEVDRKSEKLDDEEKQITTRLESIKIERVQLHERKSRAINPPHDFRTFCPKCYLDEGLPVELTPIPSDDEFDKFKCRHCGSSFDKNMR